MYQLLIQINDDPPDDLIHHKSIKRGREKSCSTTNTITTKLLFISNIKKISQNLKIYFHV